MKALQKWEVKAGKNVGIYLAVTPKQAEKFYPRWGGLNYETNYHIYKYHGIKQPNVILTTSIWAMYHMRKEWEKVPVINL